jgi:hypothetical protein
VGKLAELTRYLSIMRALQRGEVGPRLAERKSLVDVWIPHEYHLHKITVESREGLPSKKSS